MGHNEETIVTYYPVTGRVVTLRSRRRLDGT